MPRCFYYIELILSLMLDFRPWNSTVDTVMVDRDCLLHKCSWELSYTTCGYHMKASPVPTAINVSLEIACSTPAKIFKAYAGSCVGREMLILSRYLLISESCILSCLFRLKAVNHCGPTLYSYKSSTDLTSLFLEPLSVYLQ